MQASALQWDNLDNPIPAMFASYDDLERDVDANASQAARPPLRHSHSQGQSHRAAAAQVSASRAILDTMVYAHGEAVVEANPSHGQATAT
jgi:hypothetical protein